MRTVLVFTVLICSLFCNAQTTDFFTKKLSPSLNKIDEQRLKADSVDVVLSFKNVRAFNEWRKKTHVVADYSPSNVYVVRMKAGNLQQMLADTLIVFADLLRKPKEELTTGSLDISLNKLNLVHHLYPSINGEKINVSLKEQQYDINDVDWKGRHFNSGVAAGTQSGHASIMATMVGGAGNSSPRAKGAAPGVNLTSSNFEGLLPDADSIYKRFNITVQNHSYGTAIENYYGSDAAAYDASININSSLIHIFSSGNAGTAVSANGRYTGIPMFANLSGSFKMAKNIITVGAVDSFNNVMPASSKGPAYDGRVKPELVAFGQEGSSGSAALVSGAATLVQHVYLLQQGYLPSAALTKALLLNSADEVNAKQIDFTSGYGSLNAYKAVAAVKEKRFFEGAIDKGQTKSFQIKIPASVANFKIMLVWIDVPAIPNAAKALVNDVDSKLSFSSTGEEWHPWVLNAAAHIDSLQLPAIRKKDTINTVEQITVENPTPGIYTFKIKADKIVTATQKFAVVYQFDTLRNFSWTYPTASDVLEAGIENVLRWESNIPVNGIIEISINKEKWQKVSTVAALANYTKWTPPDAINTARLKFTIPSLNFEKISEVFVISRPIDVRVGFNCNDSFMLHWNRFPQDQYQIYSLDEKYLVPVEQTKDTFSIVHKRQNPSLHFAVAPKVGSLHGLRSYIINYTSQGVDCYFKTFYASLHNINSALLQATLGTIYGLEKVSFQKQNRKGIFENIHTVVAPLSISPSFTDAALSQGVNNYRISITLTNGSIINSPAEFIYYFPKEPVAVFPNPVQQSQPLNLIAQEPGIYSVVMYDAAGRQYYRGLLEDINKQIPTSSLGKGLYIIRISSKEGKSFVHKLLVK